MCIFYAQTGQNGGRGDAEMMGYGEMNNDMGRFFRTLPKYVQENLLQSGVVFRTEADLRRCAAYLMDTDGRKH